MLRFCFAINRHALAELPRYLTAVYPTELELDEEGTRISLTIVDTPGFGDQVDNEARYVDPHLFGSVPVS